MGTFKSRVPSAFLDWHEADCDKFAVAAKLREEKMRESSRYRTRPILNSAALLLSVMWVLRSTATAEQINNSAEAAKLISLVQKLVQNRHIYSPGLFAQEIGVLPKTADINRTDLEDNLVMVHRLTYRGGSLKNSAEIDAGTVKYPQETTPHEEYVTVNIHDATTCISPDLISSKLLISYSEKELVDLGVIYEYTMIVPLDGAMDIYIRLETPLKKGCAELLYLSQRSSRGL